jgi:hypothetical protein
MTLTIPNLRDSVRLERVDALTAFRFTERQARFLVTVLIHSGVFVPRQYRAFARIAHGQKTHDFLRRLVGRGMATVITPGALHRGRLFHVQFKPLYEAIGQPDNRNRKPASLGRFVERLMLLDAVLADTRVTWLGTEQDKMNYFILDKQADLPKHWYPHIVFGQGDDHTVRYFPEKLPIGIPRDAWGRHTFVYLVTRDVPADFRLFLLRHSWLLATLHEWTLRVLVPRRFRKAAALYRYAIRDGMATPLKPDEAKELDWFFRARLGRTKEPSPYGDLTVATAAQKYGAARFRAIGKMWEREGESAIWTAQSHTVKNQLERGEGRIEFVELPHQYLHLTSLVGVA